MRESPEDQAPTDRIVIRALAGKGRDTFNRHMISAKRLLRDGRFYDAAREYEFAVIANGSNPLAQVGLCLSYFAAGESLTSAYHLRRALRLFPPIMQTRVEITAIVGQKALRHRLAELDRRAVSEEVRDEKMLRFLATFLHHNAGNTTEAVRSAQILQRLSKTDKLLQAYATYMVTGKLPAPAARKTDGKPGD